MIAEELRAGVEFYVGDGDATDTVRRGVHTARAVTVERMPGDESVTVVTVATDAGTVILPGYRDVAVATAPGVSDVRRERWGDCYDRQGRPIGTEQWTDTVARGASSVARTVVEDVTVSTVWLGIDYGFGRTDAPLIFETMALGGPLNFQMERYATEAEALAGHERMVQRVREAGST